MFITLIVKGTFEDWDGTWGNSPQCYMKDIYGISTVHVGGTPQKTIKKPVHEENFISITIEEKH